MSIINQDIKGGYVKISRPGYYFNLISASGVVRVVLRKKGEDVLDSKFWVGMSVSEPIEYDTILIYGDDAPVEFWAGKVAMTQNGSITFRGANAVRSSKVDVLGATQLTGADITRQSVRIRPNQDLYIGGAGVNGTGWRIPANQVDELPVAGVIYGYKPLPKLDITKAQIEQEYSFPSSISTIFALNEFHASPDNQTVLALDGFVIANSQISTDGGQTFFSPVWHDSPEITGNNHALGYHYSRGELYLVSGVGEDIRIFKSIDNGVTFDHFKTCVAGELVGSVGNISKVQVSFNSSKLYFSAGSWSGILDLDTLDVFAVNHNEIISQLKKDKPEFDGETVSGAVYFTSDDGNSLVFNSTSSVRRGVYYSQDGGATFELVLDKNVVLNQSLTDSRCLQCCDAWDEKELFFSSDGGATFKHFGESIGTERTLAHFLKDVWVFCASGRIELYYEVNGEYVKEVSNLPGVEREDSKFLASGDLIQVGWIGQDSIKRISFEMDGDLSPVSVEVMELLS